MSSETYRPRFGYDIRIKASRPQPVPPAKKRCAMAGCSHPGEVNVPKSRQNLDDRHWLCHLHLREHNARWDYFAGMSDDEVERFCLDAITGHRPTWPLGKRAAASREASRDEKPGTYSAYASEDRFGFFEDASEAAAPPRKTRLTKAQLDALAVLNLEETASLHEVKARYKELVKRFHPDANGGNRGTEERLRLVIKAYGHLRATGLA